MKYEFKINKNFIIIYDCYNFLGFKNNYEKLDDFELEIFNKHISYNKTFGCKEFFADRFEKELNIYQRKQKIEKLKNNLK